MESEFQPFRKPSLVRHRNRIRGSDAKAIRTQLSNLLNYSIPNDSLARESCTNSSVLLRFEDSGILAGFLLSDQRWFPSLQMQWIAEINGEKENGGLPCVCIASGAAIAVVERGADLMIPGIYEMDQRIKLNDFVCVKVARGEKAIAVGIWVGAENEQKGKGVRILQVIGEGGAVFEEKGKGAEEIQVTEEEEEILEEKGIDSEIMEENLERAFMHALVITEDSKLPIPIASFYGDVMCKCVEDLDVKNTKYKKATKYFAAKTKDGVISTKTQKGLLILTGINRSNEDYQKAVGSGLFSRNPLEKSDSAKKKPVSSEDKLDIVVYQRYKFNKKTQFLLLLDFPSLESKSQSEESQTKLENDPYVSKGLYSHAQVKESLNKYLVHSQITPGPDVDLSQVPALKDLLSSEKLHSLKLKRAALLSSLISHMDAHWAISLSSLSADLLKFKPGNPPLVEISVKLRQGRKLVTFVEGLDQYGLNPSDLVPVFQKLFACSCTTQISKERKNSTTLLVQGDFSRQVSDLFTTRYGIPQKSIQLSKTQNK